MAGGSGGWQKIYPDGQVWVQGYHVSPRHAPERCTNTAQTLHNRCAKWRRRRMKVNSRGELPQDKVERI